MDYTALSKAAQLTTIRNRAAELEAQHLQISLRVNSPGIAEAPSAADTAALAQLEESLNHLRALEADLESKEQPS